MVELDPISVPEPGRLSQRDGSAFDFLDASRHGQDLSVPLGGVPRALRETAELAGLEPLTALYNEALRYAQEGHLRLARERLQMLLCMAPDDGDARLMLARVLIAGQRWSDALAALDEAQSCSVDVPLNLRRTVEEHLRAERDAADQARTGVGSREQSEIKALRAEARRNRSEAAQHAQQIADLEREVRKWAWATALVSGLTIVFIAGSLALGRPGDPSAPEAIAAPEGAPEAGSATPSTPEPAPATPPAERAPTDRAPAPAPASTESLPPPVVEVVDLGTAVNLALAKVQPVGGVPGGALRAKVHDDTVIIEGEVVAHAQRRAAERAIAAIEGVHAVDARSVILSARTRGTTHVVERGDTLSHLAWAYYGDTSLMRVLADANGGPERLLQVGEKLVIPPVED